jgi:hypothetical protein
MMQIDLDRLLKLRLAVARVGEMDNAQWWNTKGQLGAFGARALRRGFPRTHYFAQARSVFAVASHRCTEILGTPDSVTLWRLPETIEAEFDSRWEHWLEHAGDWQPYFEALEKISGHDLKGTFESLGLYDEDLVARVSSLERVLGGRALLIPGRFSPTNTAVSLLAYSFSPGGVGTPVVPFQRAA